MMLDVKNKVAYLNTSLECWLNLHFTVLCKVCIFHKFDVLTQFDCVSNGELKVLEKSGQIQQHKGFAVNVFGFKPLREAAAVCRFLQVLWHVFFAPKSRIC